MSLVGAEWVLYLLIGLSVFSVAVMIERWRFYRDAVRGIDDFRQRLRAAAASNKWDDALKAARERTVDMRFPDLESGLAAALLQHKQQASAKVSPEILSEVAQDALLRARIKWERGLVSLATIGNNAPFIGLFGTVLGIIKAFHDLSRQVGAGAQMVTAGISEALVATAVGILVAVPAVVAFNWFQRKVRASVAEAEALKSFLIGKLAE